MRARAVVSGGLAAVLLALSLSGPGAAWAAGNTQTISILAVSVTGVGSPPANHSATVTLVQGTPWTVTFTVTSTTATTSAQTVSIGVWCTTSATTDGEVKFKGDSSSPTLVAGASQASGPNTIAGTHTIVGTIGNAGCSAGFAYMQQDSSGYTTVGGGGTFTYDTGVTYSPAPPAPTAGPVPTSTAGASPAPSAPPVLGTDDPECVDGPHGTFTEAITGYTGYTCSYITYDASVHTNPGAMCRADWQIVWGGCLTYHPTGGDYIEAHAASEAYYITTNGRPMPAIDVGSQAIKFRMYYHCHDHLGSFAHLYDQDIACQGQVLYEIDFWSRGAVVATHTGSPLINGTGAVTADTDKVALLPSIDHVTFQMVAASGDLTSDPCDVGGGCNGLNGANMFVYTSAGSATGAISAPNNQPFACSSCNGGLNYSPYTGAKVCGPLSGDCTKPIPGYVPGQTCVPPSVALDVVGWLAVIACQLLNVPVDIYNVVAQPALAVVVDLFFPGRAMTAAVVTWGNDIDTHAPFAWLTAIEDGLNTALASPSAGDAPPATITFTAFGGRTADVGTPMANVATMAAPYRGTLAALFHLGFVWWLFGEVLSFLGRRNTPTEGVAL